MAQSDGVMPHSLESDILVTEEPDVSSVKSIVEEWSDREIKTVVILVGM